MRGGFFSLTAMLLAGLYLAAIAPAEAGYIGPGPAPPPPGPQTLTWANASGGSFSGQNWGGTAYLMGTGPLPPMPPDYQQGVYTGTGYSGFMFQAAPGSADTAVFETLSTGAPSPSNVLPTFPDGRYICCSAPDAIGYDYAELPAGTANYTVSLGGGMVAELDAISTGNTGAGAAPGFTLSGAFTATNLAVLEATDGSTPITLGGSGSLSSAALQIAGKVNVTGGSLFGQTVTIDAATTSTQTQGAGMVTSSTLTLTGSSAKLFAPTSLFIGQTANTIATLDLEGGAQASSGNVYVALGSAKTYGTIIINGAGSLLTTSNGFGAIGYNGTGGLTIAGGGRWLLGGATGNLFISGIAGSTGIASVDGSGSQLAADGYIIVGQQGLGSLSVSNGATVSGGEGVFVGNLPGANAFGVLNIASGGQVTAKVSGGSAAYAAILGGADNASGKAVIDGSGSLWTVNQSMRIGADGTGSVTVSNGGKLDVLGATLEIGSLDGGTGTLTIDGGGSSLSLPFGALIVGSAGTGTVMLQNGATLDQSGNTLVLGSAATGDGTIQVQSGGIFNVANLTLGGAGTGELDIGSSGTGGVTTGTANITGSTIVIGRDADSDGTLAIAGASTLNFKGSFQDGLNGTGTIGLQSGATLDTGTLTLGMNSSGTGKLAVLSGSKFSSTGDLDVGGSGTGMLSVVAGSSAKIGGDLILGQNFGSTGNSVLVGSAGGGSTTLSVGGNLIIGQADQTGDTDSVSLIGAQASVGQNVTLGGAMTAGSLTLAGNGAGGQSSGLSYGGVLNVGAKSTVTVLTGAALSHTGSGGTDIVSGTLNVQSPGSDWAAASTVDIAQNGSVAVLGGAHAETGTLDIDTDGTGQGSATVSGGTASVLTVSNMIEVDNGGGLTVAAGGTLAGSALSIVNLGEAGSGSTINVTGADSIFTAPKANLDIGGAGSASLGVRDGGSMTLGNITIGSGAAITVDGNASVLTAQNLNGDDGGGNASLTVSGGGTLNLASISQPDFQRISVDGGKLNVNNGDLGLYGDLSVTDAGVVYASGALRDQAGGSVITLADSVLSVTDIELSDAPVTVNVTDSTLFASRGELYLGSGGTMNVDADSILYGVNTIIDGGTMNLADLVNVQGVLLRSGYINLGTQGILVVGNYTQGQASFGSQLFIASNGDLDGVGTIRAASFRNGGVMHVGDDPGTITVIGNYTQLPSGSLQIEVGPGSVSQLDVTGAATLAGTLELTRVDGAMLRLGQSYDVLNATGGVTGAFTTLDTDSPFIDLIPGIAGGVLNVTTTHAPDSFADVAQTRNQMAVASALDASADTATGNFANGIDALSNASVAAVRSGFDNLSGEVYGDLATVSIAQSRGFSTAILDRMNDIAAGAGDSVGIALSGDGSHLAVSPGGIHPLPAGGFTDRHYSVWAEGNGNFAENTGGADGSHGFDTTTDGMAAGLDAVITPDWVAGAAFGYAHERLNAEPLQSVAAIDDYDVAIYSGTRIGQAFLRGAAGYVNGNGTVSRDLDIAGTPSEATGSPKSQAMFGTLETGEDFSLAPELTATPFARLDAARYWQSALTENDAGAFSLAVAGQRIDSAQTTLGAAFARTFLFSANAPVELTGSVGWAHQFAQTSRPIAAAFTGAPGERFTVDAAPLDRNSAVVSAELTTASGPADIFLRFDGQYGPLDVDSAITGGLVFTW